jgi:hypothetical protein
MTPAPDLAPVVARLEKENRNLVTRLEKLERRRGSAIAALIANVILLVSAGLLAGYLGFFPPGVDRLPLQARTVETLAVILTNAAGTPQARLTADEKGVRLVDQKGKSLPLKP